MKKEIHKDPYIIRKLRSLIFIDFILAIIILSVGVISIFKPLPQSILWVLLAVTWKLKIDFCHHFKEIIQTKPNNDVKTRREFFEE